MLDTGYRVLDKIEGRESRYTTDWVFGGLSARRMAD